MHTYMNFNKQLPMDNAKEYGLNYALFVIILSVNKLKYRLQVKYKQQYDNVP